MNHSATCALNLLWANGMQHDDTPARIRTALASSVLDIYWEAMKAHFDCPDRHEALNSILAINRAMDKAVEHAQLIPDSLTTAP